MLKKIGACIAGIAVLAAAVLAVVTLIASPSGVDADFRRQQGVKASVFAPRPKATAAPLAAETSAPAETPVPEASSAPDVTALAPPESSPQPGAAIDLVAPETPAAETPTP